MKNIFYLLFILCFNLSCQKNETQKSNYKIIDYSNIKFDKSIDMTKEFNCKPIILETNPNCIMGGIDKVIYLNKRIYILDKSKPKTIFAFNINGKFLFKISPFGGSEKECKYLTDFDIINNNIVLLSDYDRKLLFFNLNGKYVKTVKMNGFTNPCIKFVSDSVFTTASIAGGYRLITYWNNKGEKIKSFGYKYLPKNLFCYTPNAFQVHNKNLYVNFTMNDTLYKATENGCEPSIVFNFGTKKFIYKKYKNLKSLLMTYGTDNRFYKSRNYAITNNHIFTIIKNTPHTYFAMYNTKTNKYKATDHFKYNEYSLFSITGHLENGFISQISSSHIEYMNKNKHGTLFPNVKKSDNPVVFLITEKDKTSNTDNNKE